MPGQAIIRSSWIGNVDLRADRDPGARWASTLRGPWRSSSSLALFAVSLGVWVWAFAVAVARSSQGDDIAVGNLFLFEGDGAEGRSAASCSRSVGVCLVITAVTVSANPFGVLVPMLPLGLSGSGARATVYVPGSRARRFEPEVRPLRPERQADQAERTSQRSRRSRVAEQASERIRIDAPREQCLAVVLDFERTRTGRAT